MPVMTDRKAEQVSFRLPAELYERLLRLRQEKAPKQDKTDFYIEAIAFYLEMAERYGLGVDLRPMFGKTQARASPSRKVGG